MKTILFKRIMLLGLFILLVFPTFVFGQTTTYISDITKNPTRYLNTTVRISGRVSESNPAGPVTPGSYILIDDSYESITVITYDPPAPGTKITLEGIVLIDSSTQIPYVKETRVVPSFPIPIVAAVAGLVVLILIIVLIIILRKPIKEPVPTRAARPVTESVTRPRTEKITDTEAAAIIDRTRLKTDKVPSKPAQLKVITGALKGEELLLVMENIIGRDKGNIRFPSDRGVSGEHAKINYVGGKYYIANLSKTNPVKVNGNEIAEEYELKEGDEILLGTVKLIFNYMK